MKLLTLFVGVLIVAKTASADPNQQDDFRNALEPSQPVAASTRSAPTALARTFFESHETFWTEAPPPSLYTPTFERLLRLNSECVSAGESCAIDWDFWSSGQDRGVLRLERVRQVSSAPGQQIVEVAYSCDCGPAGVKRLTARIVFVQSGRHWRIDDIIRNRTSARELLSRYFAAFSEPPSGSAEKPEDRPP